MVVPSDNRVVELASKSYAIHGKSIWPLEGADTKVIATTGGSLARRTFPRAEASQECFPRRQIACLLSWGPPRGPLGPRFGSNHLFQQADQWDEAVNSAAPWSPALGPKKDGYRPLTARPRPSRSRARLSFRWVSKGGRTNALKKCASTRTVILHRQGRSYHVGP